MISKDDLLRAAKILKSYGSDDDKRIADELCDLAGIQRRSMKPLWARREDLARISDDGGGTIFIEAGNQPFTNWVA
jgi:hypothetical protein